MARKQTLEIAQDAGLERIVVATLSKIGVLVPPWATLGILAALGAISHNKWGQPPAVTWATMAATLSTVALTLLTWAVSHQRGLLGRCHSTLTTLCAGLWFTVATITGVTADLTLGMLFFGGLALGLGWNIRVVIRQGGGEGHGDPLASFFDKAKDRFGMGGVRARTTKVDDHKVTGVLELEPGGQVVEDVQKKAKYIESGMGFPPGSVIVTEDEDRADRADVSLTDPRLMKKPLPWPGPSIPAGGSIHDAMRLGLYQDMDTVLYSLIDHHLKMMGMSGSGKSFGGTWNLAAELITRVDPVIWAADITKANQTLGALEPALDWVVYDRVGAVKMLQAVQAVIEPRTRYLARKRLKSWRPGCGLSALVLLLEEAADILDALTSKQTEEFINSMRAARSAGIYIIISLQRFDYTQVPTIIRGQMAGFMCFGTENAQDSAFGLPDHVLDAGAAPERWLTNRQGMCYLAAPGIPENKHPIPLRTYLIEEDTMRDHAAHHHAGTRPLDTITATAAGPAYAARTRTRPGFSVYEATTSADRAPDGTTPAAAPATLPGHAIPAQLPAPTAQPAQTAQRPAGDLQQPTGASAPSGTAEAGGPAGLDGELLAQAAQLVITTQHASAAMLQRKLRLDRGQALRVLEALERRGIIGAQPADTTTNGTRVATGGGVDARPVLVAADTDAAHAHIQALCEDGDAVTDHLATDDPSPDITAGPDDPIADVDPAQDPLRTPQAGPGRKLDPAAARQLVRDWVRRRAVTGPDTFSPTDRELQEIRTAAGMTSRGWTYKVLNELCVDGVLTADTSKAGTTYSINDTGPRNDLQDPAA